VREAIAYENWSTRWLILWKVRDRPEKEKKNINGYFKKKKKRGEERSSAGFGARMQPRVAETRDIVGTRDSTQFTFDSQLRVLV